MTSAFSTFLTTLASHLPGNRLLALVVGNEVNAYFDAHATELAAYATFLTDAKTAAHAALSATLPITFSLAFSSLGTFANYAAITAVWDVPCWTYYPINYATFAVITPHTIGTDFSSMYTTSGSPGKFILLEVGCPSDATLGGSESDQATFVTEVAFIYSTYVGAGVTLIISYAWLNDLSSDVLDNLGLAGNLRAFEGSLGVRHADNTDKAAFLKVLTSLLGQSGLHGRSFTDRPVEAGVQPHA